MWDVDNKLWLKWQKYNGRTQLRTVSSMHVYIMCSSVRLKLSSMHISSFDAIIVPCVSLHFLNHCYLKTPYAENDPVAKSGH